MALSKRGMAVVVAAGALLAISACAGNGAVPSSSNLPANGASRVFGGGANVMPADNTSILKKLKKDVTIGSTVDPTNGDQGPRALSIVQVDEVLKKGQLLVCNFDDKSGTAGQGTTIELLNPQPSASPATFTQNAHIEGCDGDSPTGDNAVYAAGFSSHEVAEFMPNGKFVKKYSKKPFDVPFSDFNNGRQPGMYQADYLWVSDAKTGSIIHLSTNTYGIPKPLQVAKGFAVNEKSGWSALGPSGLLYNAKADVLYIADGVDNTIVAFTGASNLLVKDEIVVEKGGKTFKCKDKKFTCGKLIYSGSPLDAPVAMTLLPNGNIIAANTQGGNTLVELTPAGKVLDTKVVDKSKTAGVFGLAAAGTNDTNTVLFYTDTNSNTVQELEP
jgi:hypothetical protein